MVNTHEKGLGRQKKCGCTMGDGCNDTVPRCVHRVGKKGTACGICAGILTWAGANVTKLHNITHNEAWMAASLLEAKHFMCLLPFSKCYL